MSAMIALGTKLGRYEIRSKIGAAEWAGWLKI